MIRNDEPRARRLAVNADFQADPSNPFATNSPWIYTRDDRDTGLLRHGDRD